MELGGETESAEVIMKTRILVCFATASLLALCVQAAKTLDQPIVPDAERPLGMDAGLPDSTLTQMLQAKNGPVPPTKEAETVPVPQLAKPAAALQELETLDPLTGVGAPLAEDEPEPASPPDLEPVEPEIPAAPANAAPALDPMASDGGFEAEPADLVTPIEQATEEPAWDAAPPIEAAVPDALVTGPADSAGQALNEPLEPGQEILPLAEEGPSPFVLRAEEDDMMPEALDMEADAQERNLITVTLDEVPLQDVVRMFTRISGANIIATASNLQGTVTVNLEDVEWKPALTAILDMHQLSLLEKVPESAVYSIVKKPADAPEPQVVETFFLKYATVAEVDKVVKPMLAVGSTSVMFPSRNALIVRATAKAQQDIKEILLKIDHPRKQVFIEAKFVELNDTAIKNLGVNWQMLQGVQLAATGLGIVYADTRMRSDIDSRYAEAGQRLVNTHTYDTEGEMRPYVDPYTQEAGTGTYEFENYVTEGIFRGRNMADGMDFTSPPRKTIASFESSEARTATLSMSDFKLVLSALKELDGVDIVSNPKIIVANEQMATIHIGQREPNIRGETTTPESGAPVTTYNLDPSQPYFEFGIKLQVTPTVNTENNITVQIKPSLTRFVIDKEAPDGNKFPITAQKTIETVFTLENGHTVAIGGLTETHDRESIKKVPLLGDIPLLGKYLFSHTYNVREQLETIIFVTVGMANPESLIKESGIPERGRLIHRYLSRTSLETEH